MSARIEGKVAKILDEYNLVINVGLQDGVKEGMRFVIFARGDDVTDPDTGESLGVWEIPKGRVVAMHVQERMTICSAESSEDKDKGDPRTRTLSAAMTAVSMPREAGGSQTREKLNVERSQIEGMPQIEPISVGDGARSVEEK